MPTHSPLVKRGGTQGDHSHSQGPQKIASPSNQVLPSLPPTTPNGEAWMSKMKDLGQKLFASLNTLFLNTLLSEELLNALKWDTPNSSYGPSKLAHAAVLNACKLSSVCPISVI